MTIEYLGIQVLISKDVHTNSCLDTKTSMEHVIFIAFNCQMLSLFAALVVRGYVSVCAVFGQPPGSQGKCV